MVLVRKNVGNLGDWTALSGKKGKTLPSASPLQGRLFTQW